MATKKLFILELLKFLLFPFVLISILLAGYFYFDPFKVLYEYDEYRDLYVNMNRDYVSTETLIKNKDKYNYNSFILGSSRTIGFKVDSWKSHLNGRISPFLYDASCESIYGIYTKLNFLDSNNIPIDNALIIIDTDWTFSDSNNANIQNVVSVKHPLLSGQNKDDFQCIFLKSYFEPNFVFNFYAYKILKAYKPFMAGYINKTLKSYDKITKELDNSEMDKEIAYNESLYYQIHMEWFYNRNGETLLPIPIIHSSHIHMLNKMRSILEKHKSNYKIVISPLYDQKKFNKKDIKILRSIFGDHLIDFSGKNAFTDNKINYYESSHFRPVVGNSILNYIYSLK